MALRVEPHERSVRLHFADGSHADFHWAWLRLACSSERHPTTGEPTLCPSRVSPRVRGKEASVDGDALAVVWEDEPPSRPASRYPIEWLREHAYARNRSAPPEPPGSVQPFEVAATAEGSFPSEWRERLDRDGALVLRGSAETASVETTERWIAQLGAAGLSVVETHFGRIEDLRTDNTTNANTDQLGYTDAPIDLHTDQPFLEHPPRYQLLHCVRAAEVGGESTFADAQAAAEWLCANDAEAFEALTTLPITFHRKQKAFERVVVSPILTFAEGRLVKVRHSYFTMAPLALPFDRIEGFYRAYRALAAALDRYRVETVLRPGDALLYDNHRVLHGRRGFSGPRWVRGVYFDVGVRT